MKRRHWIALLGGLLGAASALAQGSEGNLLLLLLKPFSLLGGALRAWSLSGAAGNACVWIVTIALSLLPVVCMLILRRRRKQAGDWLFVLSGAGVFVSLFLLINPTLAVHPALLRATASSPEARSGGPVLTAASLLLTSVLVRWSGGLSDDRLVGWSRALATVVMALIAANLGNQAAQIVLSFVGGFASATSQVVSSSLPAAISLIPDGFLLALLDAAVALIDAMRKGWFSEAVEARADALAVRARRSLIAVAACIAAGNALTLALNAWLEHSSIRLDFPTTDMLLSCGALLLARFVGAACRIKRDNDLMI